MPDPISIHNDEFVITLCVGVYRWCTRIPRTRCHKKLTGGDLALFTLHNMRIAMHCDGMASKVHIDSTMAVAAAMWGEVGRGEEVMVGWVGYRGGQEGVTALWRPVPQPERTRPCTRSGYPRPISI